MDKKQEKKMINSFIECCDRGDVEEIKKLERKGLNVKRWGDAVGIKMASSNEGKGKEVLRYLLSKGADLDRVEFGIIKQMVMKSLSNPSTREEYEWALKYKVILELT